MTGGAAADVAAATLAEAATDAATSLVGPSSAMQPPAEQQGVGGTNLLAPSVAHQQTAGTPSGENLDKAVDHIGGCSGTRETGQKRVGVTPDTCIHLCATPNHICHMRESQVP